MELEIGEFIEKLNNEFSASNLEKLLTFVGAIDTGVKAERISFNQYVFLRSSTDEIYGEQERKMIQQLETLFMFPETKKTVARGGVASRTIAADLTGIGGDIHGAVLFMKIVIKAFDGWPIFILRLSDGIHIGMRLYERDQKKNCTLSEATQVEEILGNYMWSAGMKEFLTAYSIMYETVTPVDESAKDYDEMAVRRRGVQYEYIESLESIAHYMHLDTSYAIRCYKEWFDKEKSYPFYMELQDTLENLQDIKSSKVNTLEMLFEAEELERISYDSEQKYMQTLSSITYDDDKSSEALSISGKDPEEMIKLLKERRGII
ncbi:MAG: hypothetical protein PUE12_06165 [Oscillospiraceae bacterium]|nr:hypothetical protein [Oscillospiraceae bacterium]